MAKESASLAKAKNDYQTLLDDMQRMKDELGHLLKDTVTLEDNLKSISSLQIKLDYDKQLSLYLDILGELKQVNDNLSKKLKSGSAGVRLTSNPIKFYPYLNS